jgi:hypothetical protein
MVSIDSIKNERFNGININKEGVKFLLSDILIVVDLFPKKEIYLPGFIRYGGKYDCAIYRMSIP